MNKRDVIDWLSIALPWERPERIVTAKHLYSATQTRLRREFDLPYAVDLPGHGRHPYPASVRDETNGTHVFYGENGLLLEMSGRGCQAVGEEKLISLLAAHHRYTTRIDIATDIETSTMPSEFVEYLNNPRFTVSAFKTSPTGETYYIGSPKNERYARVYRYFAPHPRAAYLRIEHVARRDNAKHIAYRVLESGISQAAADLGATFGWGHPDWQAKGERIANIRPEKRKGSTVRWVYSQVFPALRKLLSDGILTEGEIREELGICQESES